MGVDIPDVRHVVHWGLAGTVLSLWQEIGRCARDGNDGIAHVYDVVSSRKTDEGIKNLCLAASKGECIRKEILSNLVVDGMDESGLETMEERKRESESCVDGCKCVLCTCCTFCRNPLEEDSP